MEFHNANVFIRLIPPLPSTKAVHIAGMALLLKIPNACIYYELILRIIVGNHEKQAIRKSLPKEVKSSKCNTLGP